MYCKGIGKCRKRQGGAANRIEISEAILDVDDFRSKVESESLSLLLRYQALAMPRK